MSVKNHAEVMKTSYDNYDSFKRDLMPNASKVEFSSFLSQMQKVKNIYDTNLQAGLDFNKRIVEFKGKE